MLLWSENWLGFFGQGLACMHFWRHIVSFNRHPCTAAVRQNNQICTNNKETNYSAKTNYLIDIRATHDLYEMSTIAWKWYILSWFFVGVIYVSIKIISFWYTVKIGKIYYIPIMYYFYIILIIYTGNFFVCIIIFIYLINNYLF